MSTVKYVGSSDARELSAADFKKLGVEDQKKLTFRRFEDVEVDGATAEALVNLGEFVRVDTHEESADNEPAADEGTSDEATTEGDNAGEMTTEQQDKAEAAARKAAETASSKSDAMEDAEGEGAHPQTTDTTAAGSEGPTGSSTTGTSTRGGRSRTR